MKQKYADCDATLVLGTDSGIVLLCHRFAHPASATHCCYDERMPPTEGWEYHFAPQNFVQLDETHVG